MMPSKYFSPAYVRSRLKVYGKVNWFATVYFNFKMFPLSVAKKLPVFFYGSVRFGSLEGKIRLPDIIRKGMIGFGQPYELVTRSKGTAEFSLYGTMIFHGNVQFGKDYFVYIAKGAICEMGHMSSLGFSGKLICYNKITFGSFARIGFESQVMDSTFHQMIDTATGERFAMTGEVNIGDYNYFGNRISVMQQTQTPSRCTVASNSVVNRDYRDLGTNILIGGIPAKLLRENISRDWEGEKSDMEKWLAI